MATSLSRIKSQIEKLQKQAHAIQSGVIARIRKEIAQHGLTHEDLFGGGNIVGNGLVAKSKKASAKKSGADKPAKYADGAGNSWHGVGKRPTWIHQALEAGHRLEEFLIGKKVNARAAEKKPVKATKKAAPAKKTAGKKAPAAKKAVTATKAAAKKAVGKKRAAKAAVAANPAAKVPAKKVPTKRAQKQSASAPVVAAAEAPTTQA